MPTDAGRVVAGGAGLAGGGNLGKSNVSKCQWNIGAPSIAPNTIGSVPPGNGNVTGPHPISGSGSAGSTGLGGSPGFAGGAILTFGYTRAPAAVTR